MPKILPIKFNLTNFPNPFNNSTTIQYEIPGSHYVSINLFNNLGQLIAQLVDGYKKAGNYEVQFNADISPAELIY